MNFFPQFISGVIIFLAFLLLGSIVTKIISRCTRNFDANTNHIFMLLAHVLKWILIVFGAITALGNMGVNVTALVTGLGLTGFGLGVALKDALSNVFSGILILVYRPFKINDQIKIGEARVQLLTLICGM